MKFFLTVGAVLLSLMCDWLAPTSTFAQSPPPVDIQINSIRYDEAKNIYILTINLSRPEFVDTLVLRVEEAEAGKEVTQFTFNVDRRSSIITDLDGRLLVDNRDYLLKVQAVDFGGYLIPRRDDNNTLDPDERLVLATKTFKHTLPQAKPIVVGVQSVNVDFEQQRIAIDIDMQDEDALQIANYQGWIVNKESGSRIHEFGPTVFTVGVNNRRLQEPIPNVMASTPAPEGYELYLEFTTKADQHIRTEPYTFKPKLPPRPGFFAQLWSGLNGNPALLIAILVILLVITGAIVLQNTRQGRDPLPPRPPIHGTNIAMTHNEGGGGGGYSMGARLTVLQTGHDADRITKVVHHFPCDIGREGCHFNVPHDGHISRRHARLTLRNGNFYLSDLESRNGTFVDNTPLPPRQPVAVSELSVVRLGTNTVIKIEPAD
ncbi:MAG: FHA domain-containing protein [Caldilineaceae bacterium]